MISKRGCRKSAVSFFEPKKAAALKGQLLIENRDTELRIRWFRLNLELASQGPLQRESRIQDLLYTGG
jgi:hypothetical protein